MNMRQLLSASVLTFALVSSGVARAQNETELKPAEKEGEADTEQAPDAPAKGSSSTHTIVKDDTLWDLSQKYLGSPWYWPKVWSYNPEIANPHWIYPGNQVRFLPTGEEVPTQVEVGEGPPEDVAPAQLVEEDKVSVTGRIGYIPKNAITVRIEGFVTDKEIEEAGVIAGSFGETEMLSFPQQLYVSFKKGAVKVGEPYIIYRTTTKLAHPEGGSFGYLTHVVGTAKVVRWSDKEKLATLEIAGDWEEMGRGDLVGPAGENMIKSIVPRPNGKEIKGGMIVAGGRYWFSTFGEHEQLIVDKGSEAGVEPGNTFTIYRHMDGLRSGDAINAPHKLDEKFPREDVGVCMAVEVKTRGTTCILLRSIRDIIAGDHVEMRTPSKGGGTSASR